MIPKGSMYSLPYAFKYFIINIIRAIYKYVECLIRKKQMNLWLIEIISFVKNVFLKKKIFFKWKYGDINNF